MHSHEEVSYAGGHLPGKRRRRKLQLLLAAFEKSYLQWLRGPFGPEPDPQQFGLTRSQCSTVISNSKVAIAKENQGN